VNPDDLLDFDSYSFDKNASYFHLCQNESIDGVELDQKFMRKLFDKINAETPGAIITADLSSSIGSRDLTKEDLW
jgi:phosphoserine aminotransferase